MIGLCGMLHDGNNFITRKSINHTKRCRLTAGILTMVKSIALLDHLIINRNHALPAFFITSSMCLPIWEGDLDTTMPASSIALILLGASPFPFWTIAPAWPILRSGGAVNPAIKPTTGLLWTLFFLSQSQAIYSAYPPISPIMTIPSVSGSTTNFSRTSMKLVPLKGSPPIPTTVDWPSPALVV